MKPLFRQLKRRMARTNKYSRTVPSTHSRMSYCSFPRNTLNFIFKSIIVISFVTLVVLSSKSYFHTAVTYFSAPLRSTGRNSFALEPRPVVGPIQPSPCMGPDRFQRYLQDHSCEILTVSLQGRLGNTMFLYASMLGIAAVHGDRLPMVVGGSIMDKSFNLTYKDRGELYRGGVDLKEIKFEQLNEEKFGTFESNAFKLPKSPTKIFGYRQSWKYFNHVRELVKREFQFYQHILDRADKVLENKSITLSGLKATGHTLIAVHGRRLDFVKHEFHRTAPAAYYQKAVKVMRQKVNKPKLRFISVSQEMTFMKRTFGNTEEFLYARDESTEVHLAVLTLCDHVITSVGSYGWFGAWLAGGHALYYPRPLNTSHRLTEQWTEADFIFPGWIPVDV